MVTAVSFPRIVVQAFGMTKKSAVVEREVQLIVTVTEPTVGSGASVLKA